MKRFLLGMALSAALAAAQPNVGDLKAYLGLSDTQASALQQIRQDTRKELQPLLQTMRDKAKAIREQSNASGANATAVGQLMIDIQNARKQVEPIRTRAHDQAVAVLTPDQQTKLAQLEAGSKHRRELRQAARLGLLQNRGELRARARIRRGRI